MPGNVCVLSLSIHLLIAFVGMDECDWMLWKDWMAWNWKSWIEWLALLKWRLSGWIGLELIECKSLEIENWRVSKAKSTKIGPQERQKTWNMTLEWQQLIKEWIRKRQWLESRANIEEMENY